MTTPRLTLVGTGHVFRIGPAVRDAIAAWCPDVVFVELDPGRYRALLARQSGAPSARTGYVQRQLEKFQQGVAGMYGAEVGEEMLAAVAAAREVGAQLRFIDPPAEETLQKALQALTWREKARAVGLLAGSAVGSVFRRKGRQDIEQEIARYQQDPEAAMEEMRRTFPSIHRVVIDERDAWMAREILTGVSGRRHGVAVVGDGHVGGILRRLQEAGQEVEVHRLQQVREGKLPTPGNSVYRFGFQVRMHG